MPSRSAQLDIEAAVFDPEDHFDSPQTLVEEAGLTRTEKLTALENWHLSVERRLDSGSEGMPTAGKAAGDAELMRQIDIARMQLEKSSEDAA